MGLPNVVEANLAINEIVKKKFGYLDAEEFEKKRSEVYTEIASFLIYNYIKGLNSEDKNRIKKQRESIDSEEFIVTLLEEITSKKEIMQNILKRYSEEYLK